MKNTLTRGGIDITPTMDDLNCIIMWPKDTVGYHNEKAAVSDILELCKQHGFGRIPQLANQIEEIWRDKDKAKKKLMAQKKKHFKLMREGFEADNRFPNIYDEDRM